MTFLSLFRTAGSRWKSTVSRLFVLGRDDGLCSGILPLRISIQKDFRRKSNAGCGKMDGRISLRKFNLWFFIFGLTGWGRFVDSSGVSVIGEPAATVSCHTVRWGMPKRMPWGAPDTTLGREERFRGGSSLGNQSQCFRIRFVVLDRMRGYLFLVGCCGVSDGPLTMGSEMDMT